MITNNPEASFKNAGELRGKVSMPALINAGLLAETQRINAGKTIDLATLDAPIAINKDSLMNVTTKEEARLIFNNRYNYYRMSNWSEFDGKFETLASSLFKLDFVSGSVMAGLCEGVEFILITSKVGKFLMHRKSYDVIHYITEEQFSTCHTARVAGFDKTTGIILTEQQITHIFAIPDSYS